MDLSTPNGHLESIAPTMRRVKEFALDLLFPVSCAGCGREETPLCESCKASLPRTDFQCVGCGFRNGTGNICSACKKRLPGLTRVVWATSYEHPVIKAMLTALKYRGQTILTEPASELLATTLNHLQSELGNSWPKDVVFVAIPLHKKKERERGFNQSYLIAQVLAKKTHIPLLPERALARNRYTPSQTTLASRDTRIKNVTGAFSTMKPELCAGKTIILIDDIATTGATLNAAATALRSGGARHVWGLVVAHG